MRTNPKTRESRLFPSMGAYVRRNAISIFRIYAQYEPLRVFWSLALLIGLAAIGVWIRFAVAYVEGNGKGHVQSLILGAVLFIAAVVLWALGVIGDLLAAQRVMTQRTFERVRRIELQLGVAPSHYEPGQATGTAAGEAQHRGDDGGAGDGGSGEAREGPRQAGGAAVTRRDRLRGRHRHRQHLRQVRLGEPRRAPPDGGLRAHARRAAGPGRGRARCSTSAAARACSSSAGRWQLPQTRLVGIDLEEESIQAGWAEHGRRRTSSTARWRPRICRSPTNEFELASAIEVLEHVPDPEHTLAEMARCAARHLLVSVPREPLWRMLNMARGAYCRSSATPRGTSTTGPSARSRSCWPATARSSRRARRSPGRWCSSASRAAASQ